MPEQLGEYYAVPTILSFEGVDKQVNSTLGKVFGNAGKKASADLAKGAGEGRKALEAELEKAAKAYDKLKDRAADAVGKVRVEEEKLAKARTGGKSEQIAVAEERLAKARRDSARMSREAQDGHRALADSQKRLADGADDTGRRLGGLGTSMRNMGTIAGGAALVGVSALAAGLVTAGNRLYELGADLDEVSDNLQVKTGLTGSALDSLRDSVEKLGTTNVPSSFADISDVAAEVTRNLHVTGPELEALTSRLANLDRMGQSVDVRSLSKAFRGFGVDAKDQVPALNSLYEASTKSGLSVDDMLSAVQKAGPALRQFGFDFGEAAALAGTFEEAGLDGEKAMAALNKAFAYFATEGVPAEQGLRDVISRIRELGDAPEASELATKVFGAKGGAGFLEAIQNGSLDLQQLQDSLRTTGLDINDVSDDTADWAEKWQTLKNDLAVALQPAATPLFDTVNGKLDELSTWVTNNQDEVIDFFVSMGEGAISAAEVSITALAGVVDTLHLFDTLVMNGFSWLPGYDDAAAKEFNDSLGDLSDKLNAAADSTMFDELRTGLRDVADEAKGGDEKLGWWAGSVKTVGDNAETARSQVENLNTALGSMPTGPLIGGAGSGSGAPVSGPLFGPGTGNALPDLSKLTPGGGGSGVGINLQLNALGYGNSATSPPSGGDKGSIANYIAQKAMASGYSPQEAVAFVAQAIGESGLDPTAYGGSTGDSSGGASGIFQFTPGTWSSFGQGDPLDAKANIDAYFRLAAARDSGSGDIRSRIAAISVGGPAHPSNNADWSGYLSQASGLVGAAPSASLPAAAVPGMSGAPSEEQVKQIAAAFGLQVTSEDRPGDPGYHGQGMALDISNGSGNTPEMRAFADYMAQTFGSSLKELIYSDGSFNGLIGDGKNVTGTSYYGQDTLSEHENHVHVAADWGNGTATGMTNRTASTGLTNAYGPGYQPGIGTPGYNEYGEPGYYEADPKAIRQATQAIADADERVKRADQQVAEAEARKAELDVDATESQRISAQNALDNAKADAEKARREADDARADAQETQRGDFKPAREAKKGSSGQGGTSQFGELGAIAGSFFKETFGFDGSFLPDMSSLMPVQMAGTLLDFFAPQMQALVPGATTSNSPFGLSDVPVPPMPAPGVHAGVGTPGPGNQQSITIDQSINGNVGWDPMQVNKQRTEALARAIPRIPTGN